MHSSSFSLSSMINKFKKVFRSSILLLVLLSVCIAAAPILAQDFTFQSNNTEQLYVTALTKQNTPPECLKREDIREREIEVDSLYTIRDGYVIEESTGEYTVEDENSPGSIRAREWDTAKNQWDCCPKTQISWFERHILRQSPKLIDCDPDD